MKKYRVINFVNIGSGECHIIPVENPAEGLAVLTALADYQLTLPETIVNSNMFGLEEWDEEEQEWYTWFDEDGYELDDYKKGEFVTVVDLHAKYYKEG